MIFAYGWIVCRIDKYLIQNCEKKIRIFNSIFIFNKKIFFNKIDMILSGFIKISACTKKQQCKFPILEPFNL